MVKVIILVIAALVAWCMTEFDETGRLRYMMGAFALSMPLFILLTSEEFW